MRRFLRTLAGRGAVAGELFAFLWRRKLWWLLPLALAVVLFAFVVLVASQPAVAPFIYTLF